MKEIFTGSLIGSALGDAIGEIVLYKARCGCIDSENLDKVISREETIKFINDFELLKYTDDTHMAIGTAESLIGNGKVNKKHMRERYVINFSLEPWRGYGNGPSTLFSMVNELSEPYRRAQKKVSMAYWGKKGSYGNGGAMRINPVGLFFYDKNIYKWAKAATGLTHTHPLGIDGSAVLAKAVSMAVQLNPKEKLNKSIFIDQLIRFARTGEIRSKMEKVKELILNNSSSAEAAKILGQSVSVHESMPMAVYSFLKYPDSFEDCLFTSILNGGDADTVGAMACGISGAYLGIKSIPDNWILKLENHEYIKALAEELYDVKMNGIDMSYEQWRSSINIDIDKNLEEL